MTNTQAGTSAIQGTDYCGCCGGDALAAPKGEHGDCCNELHNVKADILDAGTAPWNPAAFTAASADFDRRLVADALALAATRTHDEIRQAVAALPGFAGVEVTDGNLHSLALGIMSEHVRNLAAMYEREKNRASKLEAELARTESLLSQWPLDENGVPR